MIFIQEVKQRGLEDMFTTSLVLLLHTHTRLILTSLSKPGIKFSDDSVIQAIIYHFNVVPLWFENKTDVLPVKLLQ